MAYQTDVKLTNKLFGCNSDSVEFQTSKAINYISIVSCWTDGTNGWGTIDYLRTNKVKLTLETKALRGGHWRVTIYTVPLD